MVASVVAFAAAILCGSVGAKLLTSGLVGLGRCLSLPHVLAGRTLVALASSIPIATVAVVASAQRQTDLAVSFVMAAVALNVLLLLHAASAPKPPLFAAPGAMALACLFHLAAAGTWALPAVSGAGEGVCAWGLLLVGAVYVFFDALMKLHDRNVYSEIRSVLAGNQNAPGGTARVCVGEVALGVVALGTGAWLAATTGAVASLALGVPIEVAGAVAAACVASPRLVNAWRAAQNGAPDIAVENTLGGTVLDLSLALGLVGTLQPLAVSAPQRWASLPMAAVLLGACALAALRARRSEGWSLS